MNSKFYLVDTTIKSSQVWVLAENEKAAIEAAEEFAEQEEPDLTDVPTSVILGVSNTRPEDESVLVGEILYEPKESMF